MNETLLDKIRNHIAESFHDTHYEGGGVDWDKVDARINYMSNIELLELLELLGLIDEHLDKPTKAST